MLLRFPFGAREQAGNGRIGLIFGGVKGEFLPPDQPSLAAQFDNPLKELLKGGEAIALADLAQAAMIRNGLGQVIANIPAMRQIDVDGLHELALGANAFEEGNQLQLKEDD